MDVHIPCPCPGTPHPDGDTVVLRDKPTLPMGLGTTTLMMQSDPTDDMDAATLTGRVAQIWIVEGIESWTLVDDEGKPQVCDRPHIKDLMADFGVILPLVEAATDLYSAAIIDPLVARTSRSIPPGQTKPSTSATSESPKKRRSPSTPSSPDTSEASTPSEE